MTDLINKIRDWAQSPAKSAAQREARAQSEEHASPRGLKRKANNPYDFDSEELPSEGTRLRVSSEAPISSPKALLNASKNKRPSQSPFKKAEADGADVDTIRATGRDAPSADSTDEKESSAALKQAVAKADAHAIVDATINLKHSEASSSSRQPAEATKNGPRQSLAGEELEVEKLLKHRFANDGTVELQVQWAGESEDQATFEPEVEIQRGAAETLYEFWEKQGGRTETLFYKGDNPPPEVYHVFAIHSHQKKQPGGFHFEVQWIGYPKTRGNTTMEPEAKLKKVAPRLLDEYWAEHGGRDKFLTKRGRGKKPRSD